MSSIEKNLFHIVGIGSIVAGGWLAIETKGFLSEWKSVHPDGAGVGAWASASIFTNRFPA